MANHASAIKRNRQTKKREENNRFWKSRVRNVSKKVLEACEKKDKKTAETSLATAMKEISRASGKMVIHARTASRKIARLSRAVSAIQ